MWFTTLLIITQLGGSKKRVFSHHLGSMAILSDSRTRASAIACACRCSSSALASSIWSSRRCMQPSASAARWPNTVHGASIGAVANASAACRELGAIKSPAAARACNHPYGTEELGINCGVRIKEGRHQKAWWGGGGQEQVRGTKVTGLLNGAGGMWLG